MGLTSLADDPRKRAKSKLLCNKKLASRPQKNARTMGLTSLADDPRKCAKSKLLAPPLSSAISPPRLTALDFEPESGVDEISTVDPPAGLGIVSSPCTIRMADGPSDGDLPVSEWGTAGFSPPESTTRCRPADALA
ncbi:hypothetical protein PanWU01x14_301730 [Parasponia andersonii]|uniref:Uncharacterized protein n=1 Tax=Parasponia andersonii TaxID=3476 RepID=A0A2P5ATI6_PARAD|nr:hypothetical protein PanWU01x14_301730 [Parasponia andersonii]